jgi:hypothetical protein
MYTRPSAPLPVGGVVDDAIKLYRASFRASWKISLLGSILFIVSAVYVAASIGPTAATGANPANLLAMVSALVGKTFTFLIALTLVYMIVYVALFLQINQIGQGRPAMGIGALLGASIRRLPGVFVSTIIFAVAISVGSLLLLIPGIYIWGKLQFWLAAMAADESGAIEALGRSWSATTSNWWRTSVIVAVAIILLIVLQLVVNLLSGVMVGLVAVASLQKGSLMFLVLPQLLSFVWYVFFLPAMPAVQLATYYDLTLRRGGTDLAARAESLKPA